MNEVKQVMKLSLSYLSGILLITWVNAAVASPEMTVDQPAFNFGSVHQGKKVEHLFIIRNSGDTPLIIKSVSPSCGCTAASTTASVISPGTTGGIKSSFDSTNFTGAVQKTIKVTTNDFRSPTTTLTLQGTVIEEIMITPKQLSLGKVKINETAKAYLVVTNKGTKPLKLTSVRSPLPQVVAVSDKKLLNPGESAQISVTFRPGSGDRLLSGYLAISTDNPDKAEILVPVYGSPVH
jgi:hypothetical protein